MRIERHPEHSKSKTGGFLASTNSLKKLGGGGSILSYRFFLILVLVFPSSLWAQDTTPPTVSSATVDGTALVVNLNEGLASVSGLTNSVFTVKKTPDGGSETEQMLSGTPTVRGETVTLTLVNPVIASDRGTVKLIYTAPTESGAKLRDAAGSDVVDSMDPKVLNICSRSEVVRDAILAQITETVSCGEVTSNDLRTITVLDLSQRGITELKSDDFNGLTNLLDLDLRTNSLTDLHQDLFDGLTNLSNLQLDNNSLTSLHQDLFKELTKLVFLGLENNSLTSLHEELFDGLTSLNQLYLDDNALTDLHQDLFEELTELGALGLNNNSLTDLHQDLFDGLTSLSTLRLDNNALTSLYENLFDELTSLRLLFIADNEFTGLHEELFHGLTSLESIILSRNSLTDLHQDLFDGLTSLNQLYLNDNALTDLHEDLFDGLESLSLLSLHNNALTDLPEDLFDGLTKLATLNLDGNALTDLPEDLFDGLTSLQFLILAGNNLTSLHPDLFDDVEANPFTVSLEENELTCVPAKILNQENVIINPASLRVACPDLSVTLSVNPSTIGEEDEATEVTVTATLEVFQTTTLPVTVSVGSGTATSGTDFTAVSDFTISIPADTRSSTGTFTLTPTSDTVDEPDETVMITGTSTVENVTVTGTSLTIIDDDTSTAAQAPTELPTVFTLHGNYPNPFNPSTRIQFDLPERAQVTVQILDVLGRKVMEYPAQAFDAGANQTIELNAIQLGSGTYLYQMIAVGSETKYQETGRMILMK